MKTSIHDWPAGTPDYTTHDVMRRYIDEVTNIFGVHDRTRYQTNVLEVKKLGDSWNIRSRSRKSESKWLSNKHEATTRDERFDAVVVTTGHYHAPRVPAIPGLKELKQLHPDLVSHSKAYRGAEQLKGKSILVVGSSASAIDIIRDAIPLCSKVYHSGRGGQFDVPPSFFPLGTVHIGEVINIEPKETGISTSLNAKFHLADGTNICDIDAVILCTGYLISLPFLAQYHDDDMPVDKASKEVIITDGMMYHNLHKDMFYIPEPTLVFVGVPYFTANFSLFDFQAQAVAANLAGLAGLPSQQEMRQEYNDKLVRLRAGKQFHSLKGVEVDYVKELLDWVNPQLQENGEEVLKGHTPEWLAAKEDQAAYFREAFATPQSLGLSQQIVSCS
jgi:ACS family pantothenate transporter-like MFS transporter